jgi:hypothetical protein
LALSSRTSSCDTERRTDRAAQTHVPPITFTDTAPLKSNEEGTTENLGSLKENTSLVKDTNVKTILKPRSYQPYNFDQIEKLFDLVIEKDAALITDINVRTAQRYIKKLSVWCVYSYPYHPHYDKYINL